MLGAFDETLPGGGDLMQLWSFGPFLENVIAGLAGIHPQPDRNRVDLFPQLPRTLEWFKLEDIRIGDHRWALEQRRIGKRIITTVAHTGSDVAWSGRFWLPETSGGDVTVNGAPVEVTRQLMRHSGTERAGFPLDLPTRAEFRIEYEDR
jgi:hypothetical protein